MPKKLGLDKTDIEEQYRRLLSAYTEAEDELLVIQKKLQAIHDQVQGLVDKTEMKKVLEQLVQTKE